MATLQWQARRPGGTFRNEGASFTEGNEPSDLASYLGLSTGVWVLRLVVDGTPSSDEIQLRIPVKNHLAVLG